MPRNKMLFLLPSLESGGAERQTIDLVNRLDRDRFSVSLGYLVQSDRLRPLLDLERLDGLHCLEKRHRFDPGVLQRLRALVRESGADTVVCVNPYTAFYCHLLRMLLRERFALIEVIHSTTMPDRYNELVERGLYSHLSNRSNAVVFVCRNQMTHWQQTYGIRKELSRCIYNGIDTAHFRPYRDEAECRELKKRLGIREGDAVVCICATLSAAKRHVDLVDAAKLLRDQGVPVKILMVGDGAERRALERHIVRRQMSDAVVITGFVLDVRPYLAVCDLFVLVSTSVETFSMAVLEAMAMGKALVLSDLGGASEQVIDGVNGFLFPAGDVGALAARLATALSGDSQAMGLRSRSMVCERFSVERMVAGYQALFEEVSVAAGPGEWGGR